MQRDQIQQEIRAMVRLQGFAIQQVLASGNQPSFAYTVGLHLEPAWPEIMVSGLPPETCAAWLLTLGYQMKRASLTPEQQAFARRQGFDLEVDLPPARFEPGVFYAGLAEDGYLCCFGEVEPRYGESHFGQALAFYRKDMVPILQMVWCDRRGRFPWQTDFEERFRDRQQLLFDPENYYSTP